MSLHREYNGVEINAHALMSGDGLYVPCVTLTRHNAADVKEIRLEPPCEKGFKTRDEALEAAMIYGLAAVDGELPGFDVCSLA